MSNRKKRMYAAIAMILTGVIFSLILFAIKETNTSVAQFYAANTAIYIIVTTVLSAVFEIPGFVFLARYFFFE